MDFLSDLSKDIITGLIGTLIGFVGKTLLDILVKYQKDRLLLEFLNLPPGKILIIHSALFDKSRTSYNYPSCDMISVRKISNLLESIGKKEGVDFFIAPEANFLTRDGEIDRSVYGFNLILLGGPKRNKFVTEILRKSVKPRYDMYLNDSGQNVIYDNRVRNYLIASRDQSLVNNLPTLDTSKNVIENKVEYGHDYGLIMTMPNPLNLTLTVLILAGIHGPGTIGVVEFISDKNNLQDLNRRRKGNLIQEVVSVDYDEVTEQAIDVSLV